MSNIEPSKGTCFAWVIQFQAIFQASSNTFTLTDVKLQPLLLILTSLVNLTDPSTKRYWYDIKTLVVTFSSSSSKQLWAFKANNWEILIGIRNSELFLLRSTRTTWLEPLDDSILECLHVSVQERSRTAPLDAPKRNCTLGVDCHWCYPPYVHRWHVLPCCEQIYAVHWKSDTRLDQGWLLLLVVGDGDDSRFCHLCVPQLALLEIFPS